MMVTMEKELEQTGKILPEGWKWVKLGDICELNPSRPRSLQYAENSQTTFVPMPSVDAHLGEITKPEIKTFEQVKKGYTYFQEGDVLFAKITPCMQNGKHAIARNLINGFGFGTTEFHVIRPKEGIVSDWIHRFLRQPTILEVATDHFTGSVGQQRIPISYLETLIIPLPPLAEQKRIVAILNEKMAAIEKARAATLAQIEAAKALPAAYLRQVFDSPEAQTWERKKLGEISEIVSGIALGRQLKAETFKIPYLRVANVKDGHLDLSEVYTTEATESEIQKCLLKYGDILLTEGGDLDKLGRGSFWEEKITRCIHQNHIFRVRFDLSKFCPQFVSFQISSTYGKAYFLSYAKKTTGLASINKNVLSGFPMMIPSLDRQRQITLELNEKQKLSTRVKQSLQEQLEVINAIPAAILKQAFNGEL
jgi:type I restriction enzyme S subunit